MMADLEMVFRGTEAFWFLLPEATIEAEIYGEEYSRFEAFLTLDKVKLLQGDGPNFPFVQAICVSKIESHRLRSFQNGDYYSVLVRPTSVRWILCFRAVRWGGEYSPRTYTVDPFGSDVFFSFRNSIGSATDETPIRAVPCLEDLKFLSPRPNDRLALMRAKKWNWDEKLNTVLIPPQEVLEKEIVLESKVRVF